MSTLSDRALNARGAAILTAALVLASLPAFFAPAVGVAMDRLYAVIDPSHPYMSLASPALLYAGMPIAVASSLVLVMAPGVLLALAVGRRELHASVLFLRAFALSLLAISVPTAIAQSILGAPLVGSGFVALVHVVTCASGAFLIRRCPVAPPQITRADLVGMVAFPMSILIALTPKLFWESFNGDGAHSLEATRLLLQGALPFWPEGVGGYAHFPGMNTLLFTYPASWFVRLFGEIEAGVRLPFLLEIALLYAAIAALAERDPSRPRLSTISGTLIVFALMVYTIVMAYSATYDPYCADIALPATQDTLLMALFLACVHAYLERSWAWLAAFVPLVLTCSPNGLLLLGLFGVAVAAFPLVRRGARWPWKDVLRLAAISGVSVFLVAAAPDVLTALGVSSPGSEHSGEALLSKFEYLMPFRFKRILYAAIPSGIYPLAAFLALRKMDDAQRALAFVALAVFGMFYLMAFVSLHYFVPAMVLPIALFWMVFVPEGARAQAVAAGSAVAAAFLSMPASGGIYTATREIGAHVDATGVPGYREMKPEVYRASFLLDHVFRRDSDVEVPAVEIGLAEIALNHYAHRTIYREVPKNYFIGPTRSAVSGHDGRGGGRGALRVRP